jgi:hypothetical protein
VRIFQRKKKILQTQIGLEALGPASGSRLPLYRREAPENVPLRVPDQCQSGPLAVAAGVKAACAEAIAAAAPQQRKVLPAELSEERRKVRDDQGSEVRGRSGQREGRGSRNSQENGGLGGTAGNGPGLEARMASTVGFSRETVGGSRWAARSSSA